MAPTLYYAPTVCSLSPHIVLRELGIPFDLARVDLRAKKLVDGGGDWLALNPKGYVPALRLDDGNVLTEGAVMIRYLADTHPEAGLAPAHGTLERVRLDELLHFIATELHKGMGPLYNVLANDDYKAQVRQRLATRVGQLAETLGDKPYLTGERFSIADAYAFYVLRAWQRVHKQELTAWPTLVAYYERVAARPAVNAALAAEGIAP